MKGTKKLVLAALLLLGAVSYTTTNAQSTATATTPCGTYTVESEESFINISVSTSSRNGTSVSEIYVNGELYKEVSCESTSDVIDFPDLTDDSGTDDNSNDWSFGSFFDNFSFGDFFKNFFRF